MIILLIISISIVPIIIKNMTDTTTDTIAPTVIGNHRILFVIEASAKTAAIGIP